MATGSPDVATIAQGVTFTDVAELAGLTEPHSELGLTGQADMTSGAAVADVDGDGDDDIFLPRVGRPNGLYLNNGDGTFDDVARDAGVAGPDDRFGSSTGVFFDVEGDGDVDLFAAGAGLGRNELFINDGSGRFSEEAAGRGLEWPEPTDPRFGGQHHGVSVADVNRDGFLDLLVLQWYSDIYNGEAVAAAAAEMGWADDHTPDSCETAAALAAIGFPAPGDGEPTRSALFLNDGAGSFSDVTAEFGLPLDEIVAFTGAFGDIDDDGWTDLAITGDGCTSRLLRNVDGRRFEDITATAGVATDENGMGSVLRDIDGDGDVDWFITGISYPLEDTETCPETGFSGCSGNRLYLNNGDLTFSDATDQAAVRDGGWGWGAALEDLDHDRDIDIVMTNGFSIDNPGRSDPGDDRIEYLSQFDDDRARVWLRDGDTYREVAGVVGIDDTAVSHALVPFDMDNDGDLDVLVVPSGDVAPRLYRNDSSFDRAWLSVVLDDATSPGNRTGDGSRVEITPDAGDDPLVGWITTGGSYESQKPPVVHVGLGARTAPISRIEVYWPGASEPQILTDVEPDQRLVVSRTN